LVLMATDTKENNKPVAIKVIADTHECKEQAKREVEMLKFLNKIDHEKGFIVRLLDVFKYKKRNYCLVFEQLDMNLYELML